MRRKVNEIADNLVSENQLPVPRIDRLLHEPARFMIAAHLYATESADLLLLFQQTELTWGNLFSHVRKLETAGYVTVRKGPAKNGSRTAVQLTDKGRSAFERYCHSIGRCFEQVFAKRNGDGFRLEGPDSSRLSMRHVSAEVSSPAIRGSDETAGILRKTLAFSDPSEEQLVDLSRLAVRRHVKSGQFLYLEGHQPEHFYVIAGGRIKILKHSPSGKDFIIAFSVPGEVLGILTLYLDKPHSTSAQAAIDADVLAIKNDEFIAFLHHQPELGVKILGKMLTIVSTRFTNALRRLTELSAERADHRLAHVLYALSLKYGLTLPFAREEVAQMAGTTTETAIRFVNHLQKMGFVSLVRRKIIILDPAKLRSLDAGLPAME